MKFRRVRRGNCLTYVLRRYMRRGGYIVMRRSHAARRLWWPHFLWVPRLGAKVRHFAPVEPRRIWMLGLPRIVFMGSVIYGRDDDPEWGGMRWRLGENPRRN